LFHTGAKFFYLQEARKIYSTLHTGANFSIFVRRKIGKIRKVIRNGPREGVRPNIDRNGPREGVRPDDDEMGLVKE
jgi:hypothetical protein